MKKRRFHIYKHLGDKLYWRTTCEHADGRKDTFFNVEEARKKCDSLKREGIKFYVDEVIRVTDEFA